jgi:hypothetical protein
MGKVHRDFGGYGAALWDIGPFVQRFIDLGKCGVGTAVHGGRV